MYKQFVILDPWKEPRDHRQKPFERDIVPLFGPEHRGVDVLNANIVSIPPGSGTNYHSHVIGELIFIVDGVAEILLGDERFEVLPDSVFWAPEGAFHHVRNTGSGELKIFTVFAPGMTRDHQKAQVQVKEPPEVTHSLT
ncbi:MAG: cupin domain-containing protein [Spirochaetota bacterium]